MRDRLLKERGYSVRKTSEYNFWLEVRMVFRKLIYSESANAT
jgi:hypothetical protein